MAVQPTTFGTFARSRNARTGCVCEGWWNPNFVPEKVEGDKEIEQSVRVNVHTVRTLAKPAFPIAPIAAMCSTVLLFN